MRIDEIETLRATAILMVLVEHIPANLVFWPAREVPWISGFWVGVDLFFAISGFVIARALLPRLAAVGDWTGFLRVSVEFWIRRAWRLMPSAWLWLVLPLPLCLLFNRSHAFGGLQANWEMLIAGILDLANFRIAMVFGQQESGTGFVQWSLSLEEQFYLLLPFAAFLLRKRLPYVLALIAALGFVVPNIPIAYMLRLWPVALGVLVALWSQRPGYQFCAPRPLARSATARLTLYVLACASLLSLGTTSLHIVPFFQGPIAVLSAALVWIASYDRGYLALPRPLRALFAYVASRSYSLYLIHIPVYFAAHELWFRLHGGIDPTRRQAIFYVVAAFAALFAVADLNYRWLELPLREKGKTIAQRFAEGFRRDEAEAA